MKTQNETRAKLIELSQMSKELINCDAAELEGIEGELNINSVIVHVFYPAGEYNTFAGWKEKGLIVEKGSKGFPVWSKKRNLKKTNKDTGESKEYSTFLVAHIFHESQVKALEPKIEKAA